MSMTPAHGTNCGGLVHFNRLRRRSRPRTPQNHFARHPYAIKDPGYWRLCFNTLGLVSCARIAQSRQELDRWRVYRGRLFFLFLGLVLSFGRGAATLVLILVFSRPTPLISSSAQHHIHTWIHAIEDSLSLTSHFASPVPGIWRRIAQDCDACHIQTRPPLPANHEFSLSAP